MVWDESFIADGVIESARLDDRGWLSVSVLGAVNKSGSLGGVIPDGGPRQCGGDPTRSSCKGDPGELAMYFKSRR